MELDPQKLQTRVADIQENLAQIRAIIKLSDQELISDPRNLAAIKYNLIVILEALGSICTHICAKKLQKAVSEYADCFDHLCEAGLVDKELGEQLIKMARFRNRLVHMYWNTDDQLVLQYVRSDLKIVEEFIKVIGKLI